MTLTRVEPRRLPKEERNETRSGESEEGRDDQETRYEPSIASRADRASSSVFKRGEGHRGSVQGAHIGRKDEGEREDSQ